MCPQVLMHTLSPDNSSKRKCESSDSPVAFTKSLRLSLQDANLAQLHVRGSSIQSQSFSQLSRAKSKVLGSQKKLALHHKQKLLWTVATVLHEKSVSSSHPDYSVSSKQYLSTTLIPPSASRNIVEAMNGTSSDDVLIMEQSRRGKISSQSPQPTTKSTKLKQSSPSVSFSRSSRSQFTVNMALRENIDTQA